MQSHSPMKQRRFGRYRRLAVALVAASSLAALTACSPGGTTAASGSQTIVYALQALPDTLQPENLQAGLGIKPIITTEGSLLFQFDNNSCTAAPNPYKVTGVLAKSYKVSSDRKTITVTLRDGKSEAGNPLTSEDVKWSVQRNLAVNPIVQYLGLNAMHLDKANPITVVDTHTFTINLSTPSTLDLVMWTVPSFLIYDSTELKKHATSSDPWASEWLKTHTASFGPYGLQGFDQGNQLTLTKNKGWTGEFGGVGKVVFKQVAGAAQQAQLVAQGSVNYAANLSWSQYKSLASNPKVKVWDCASLSREVIALQESDPNFSDPKVRQAISLALNRDDLIKGARSGYGTPALTGFLPGLLPKGVETNKFTEDQSKAKSLLQEAGKSNLTFTLGYYGDNSLPILVQSQLQKIGVTVQLKAYASGNDFNQAQREGTYQALTYSNQGVVPELVFEAGLVAPGSPANGFNYKNPEYNTLLSQLGAQTPGSDQYNSYAQQLTNLFVQDVPNVTLINLPNIFVMSSSIKGAEKGFGTITTAPNPAYFDSVK